MIHALDTIIQVITTVINIVISLITGIVNFFIQVGRAMAIVPQLISYLPSEWKVAVLAILSIIVIINVLNKGG